VGAGRETVGDAVGGWSGGVKRGSVVATGTEHARAASSGSCLGGLFNSVLGRNYSSGSGPVNG
jgi:hypothetical protein